ncbi:CLAVATA3/ESR (CLE)-related protein 13 [Striga hermonthica]|uniref:CLAVATA3/ESR (CLE)-related protein 13 n=1 Tax=Striga hermonthica TaxID=68872 RepID=A0A9N7NM78_STRHE|nr:CLAVATA3/ESR (CLE)-related protein 13 [Striga hermonthica]
MKNFISPNTTTYDQQNTFSLKINPFALLFVLMILIASPVGIRSVDISEHLQPSRRHLHRRPPPAGGCEIDPRYGVEKRLVPSGPNPLHN